MGASGNEIVKSQSYFETEIKKNNIKNSIENLIETSNEKISLEFSIQNTESGKTYNIDSFFLERGETNFKTEEKTSKGNDLTFEKLYICNYYFEREQKMQIIIYKEGSSPINIMTTLATIVGSKHNEFVHKIGNKEILIIKAKALGKSKSYVNIKINIKNDNKEINYLSKKKFIFQIFCNNRKLYSSESITEDGNFEQVAIPCILLSPEYTVNICNPKGDEIKCSYVKSLDALRCQGKVENNLQLKLPISKEISLSIYDDSLLEEKFSLFDLISSGTYLSLSLGIDFTGSNGHPLDKDTLHCKISEEPNDYEKVIKSIGNLLSNYSYNKLYPVFGFGAILNFSPFQEVSHCFNINFQDNPEIFSIDGVLNVYRSCLDKLTFAGPTYFTPILSKVIDKIRLKNNDLEYNILMILTDGNIDDMKSTKDAIVEGSFLPLSVVIVGIGNADFSKMVELDGNEIPLVSSSGIKWLRDIVQFIHYNKYKNNEAQLIKEILEEIPRQIIEYYKVFNYNPDKIKEISRKRTMERHQFEMQNNLNNFKNIEASSGLDLPTKSQIVYNNPQNYNNNNIPNKYDAINLSNNYNDLGAPNTNFNNNNYQNNYNNNYNNMPLNNNLNNINNNNVNNYPSEEEVNNKFNSNANIDLEGMEEVPETFIINNNNNNNNNNINNQDDKKDSFSLF